VGIEKEIVMTTNSTVENSLWNSCLYLRTYFSFYFG